MSRQQTLQKDTQEETSLRKSHKSSHHSGSSSFKYSTATNPKNYHIRSELSGQNDQKGKPKPVGEISNLSDFVRLGEICDEFIQTLPKRVPVDFEPPRRSSLGAALKLNIDGIIAGLNDALLILYEKPSNGVDDKSQGLQSLKEKEVVITPFIKVALQQSPDIVLYEQRSLTVPADTPEANKVTRENKAYEFVTKGKGRLRRKAEAETQTKLVLYKSRDANTDVVKKLDVGSQVSTSEMFDTYRKLQLVRSSLVLDDDSVVELTTYKMDGSDPSQYLSSSKGFNLSQMITQRTLAGNTFREQQRRFRNMYKPDPLAKGVDYLYSIRLLWQLYIHSEEVDRRAVSCMCFCPSNGDILVVGYGVYTLPPLFTPKSGYLLFWSMKNPVWPEKRIDYKVSVTAVEFSPFRPQLLAIGLYDGSVEVRDITTEQNSLVAVSQRESSPGYEPVLDIKWVENDPGEYADIEPFLTVSQDGSVMKYRCINSPYLLGYTHAVLDRVEGTPEGLPVRRSWNTLEAVRNPQLLGITLDPKKPAMFNVISNEGVIYNCSTNYPQQHLSLWQTHEGSAFTMDYSPWSPKVFLTCGEDWCIRIWVEGIFKPLVTLTGEMLPVNCAYWSKTHSTVIVSVNKSSLDVWDIRRSTLKPMSSTKLESSHMTTMKFSNCGRSIAVGNEKGHVDICALEDLPFPPVFQYEELEAAIFKDLMRFPDLVTELKSIGYFGYPKEKRSII